MRPFEEGFRLTVKVRIMHARVRRMIEESGEWNAAAWGVPINQHDMAGTTLLFSVAMLDGLRKLGLRIDAEEGERYVHLWRWVGQTIGVDPRLLPTSEADAMRLADLIAATTGRPDQDARDLTKALFDTAWNGAHTPKEKRDAARRYHFATTLCRELVGDALADDLGVPTNRFRYALPIARRFVAGASRVTRSVPFAERSAVAAGMRYWDRVVAFGMQGKPYDFEPPDALGTRRRTGLYAVRA